jgi:RimJ/RimL family protein N-acetyltransferase
MTYRELKIEDFRVYNELREMSLNVGTEIFVSTNDEEKNNRKAKFLSRIQDNFSFVMGAFDGNILVGMVTFIREDRIKIKHKGGIYGMFIHPNYQGKGIGSELLKLTLDNAFKISGLRQINLGVIATNLNAIKLYEKMGFKPYGVEKEAIFVNDTFLDELLMVKMIG